MSAAAGISDEALLELRALAVSVAREAGDLLADRAGQVEVAATKSSPTDVVTEMDRRSEELIRSRILAARPSDAILGEEGGMIGPADSARWQEAPSYRAPSAGHGSRGDDPPCAPNAGNAPVLWVIDPLDGTVNYLYGLHDWAVSIAAEVAGEIVTGAVYVPVRGELFCAVKGGGAVLESADGESKLHCNTGVPLERALIGTGFGYLAARRKVQGEVVAAILPQVRDIRRIGVASIDLCAVAAGRLDGFYERGLNYWDWAAGALIAAEAGAVAGGLDGRPVSQSLTVVAGPGLFGPLTAALAALDPERDA